MTTKLTTKDRKEFFGMKEKIKSLLARQRKEITEMVKGMKKRAILRGGDGKEFDAEEAGLSLGSIAKGYNQAIDAILEKLEEEGLVP